MSAARTDELLALRNAVPAVRVLSRRLPQVLPRSLALWTFHRLLPLFTRVMSRTKGRERPRLTHGFTQLQTLAIPKKTASASVVVRKATL